MNRQDSLNDQMADVMRAAVVMGCYDAHDWLLRFFDGPQDLDDARRALEQSPEAIGGSNPSTPTSEPAEGLRTDESDYRDDWK